MNVLNSTELDSLVFCFISTTSFYDSTNDVFPAELAMAKFSLKQGIFDDIQIRINPGALPEGSAGDVAEKADKTHKYPLPPDCAGQKDYLTILEIMIQFLHPLDRLPIFFSAGNTRDNKIPLDETRKVLRKIFYESEEDDVLADVKVYPIEELFFIMQRVTTITKNRHNETSDVPFTSITLAANKFNNDSFCYSTTGCVFHRMTESSQHCCLSKVRRFGYTISMWCANGRRYDLLEGKHFPQGRSQTGI